MPLDNFSADFVRRELVWTEANSLDIGSQERFQPRILNGLDCGRSDAVVARLAPICIGAGVVFPNEINVETLTSCAQTSRKREVETPAI